MSVNYTLLADNDPGGELDAAFATMSSETVTSTPEVMVTYRRISAAVSLAVSAELEGAVKAAEGAGAMPSWIDKALAFDGINVNDAQVRAVLDSLVSPESASAIRAMGVNHSVKYTGLRIEDLEKAREMRTEGLI